MYRHVLLYRMDRLGRRLLGRAIVQRLNRPTEVPEPLALLSSDLSGGRLLLFSGTVSAAKERRALMTLVSQIRRWDKREDLENDDSCNQVA